MAALLNVVKGAWMDVELCAADQVVHRLVGREQQIRHMHVRARRFLRLVIILTKHRGGEQGGHARRGRDERGGALENEGERTQQNALLPGPLATQREVLAGAARAEAQHASHVAVDRRLHRLHANDVKDLGLADVHLEHLIEGVLARYQVAHLGLVLLAERPHEPVAAVAL